MKILVVFLLTFVTCTTYAQLTGKEKKAARKGESINEPTTLSPGNTEPNFSPRHSGKKLKKSNGPTYNAQKEFEDRMEARAKTYRKNEKMLMKRQFNDPSYFGHKHKPKKHSADKMRYCKECGIRH